jgi:hypothetical protein
MANNLYSNGYNLAPQAGTAVTLTLLSGSFNANGSFTPGSNLPSITVGSVGGGGASLPFTIYNDSEYAEGFVTITYASAAGSPNPTAECHLDFFLSGSIPYWSVDANGYLNDDTSIIGSYSNQTPGNLPVVQPTGALPPGPSSLYQVLDENMVFLVDLVDLPDKNVNMLFRGNVPFAAPTVADGPQQVDFANLHNYMKVRYEAQTGKLDFPAIKNYILRVVCLQSSASEGDSILMELKSFGGDSLGQLLPAGKYYPNIYMLPDVPRQQMCNFDLEPGDVNFDFNSAQSLRNWMNTSETLPCIYYIHCASGHDRTGMMAAAYLIMNKQNLNLQQAFICGTTVAKLPPGMSGNQLHVDCNDIDGINEGNIDPNRSRITLIATVYNQTVLDIYNQFNSSNPPITLPAIAIQTDPAYVYSEYPWEFT